MVNTTLEAQISNPRSPVEQEIARLGPWFHNVHLPDGVQTAPNHPLGDFPAFKWNRIAPHLPADMTGWNVLDIGCNAGYYCFEFARRGACVTGIDLDPHYLEQAAWAAKRLGLEKRVSLRRLSVYELAGVAEQYDLVAFMGLFYHLRYPLLALDIVTEKTGKLLLFQTLTMPGEEVFAPPENLDLAQRELLNRPGWPRMAFIEHSLAGDSTNWWAPNHAGVGALLRSSGFRFVERIDHEIYLCTGINAASRKEPAEEMRCAAGLDRGAKGPV